jgi:glutamate dehydrogenase (NAD(P)+)
MLEDEIGTEKIVILKDTSTNLKAFVVVDNSAYGMPAGGLRLAPDLTLKEIMRLARAMTYKFCTYKIPIGGAKSGILGDPLDKNKDLLITSYANLISPFIRGRIYFPGMDMGTNELDHEKIFTIAGLPDMSFRKIKVIRNGYPIEDHFTGYGVVFCLKTIFEKIKRIKNSINTPKIMVEGFGKVGKSVVLALKEFGFKLVGLSTVNGAIYDDDGLDINELISLRKNFGDDAINKYQSKNLIKVEKEKLFSLSSEYSTDFIIPGARPDAINKKNIDKIETKAIVCAANIPYAEGIINSLEDKGIIAFPDFVSNGGATIVESRLKNPWTTEQIFNFLQLQITSKTSEIIHGAKEQNVYTYEFAKSAAIKEFKKYADKRKRKVQRLNKGFQIK